MSIALAVFTDGRDDCLHETVRSALRNLQGPITHKVMHDDTGDATHRAVLADLYGPLGFEIIGGERAGFGGAIRRCWQHLQARPEQHVFHLEDDFTFNRPVNLVHLAAVLNTHPHVVQIALRRQPCNDHERLAGGVIEQHPDAYSEMHWGPHAWLQHRLFMTTNPSLYRRSLCFGGWPEGPKSEGWFTHRILTDDPHAVFAYWGARDSGEAVTHIGDVRAGVGY